jgi:hypothetical protein
MRRAAFAIVALAHGGCLLQDNPAYEPTCGDGRFAFAVIADAPATDTVALSGVLAEIAARPDVHMVFGAGDLVPMADVRAAIDGAPAPSGECAPAALAWFPAMGAAELARPDDLAWWSSTWASGWADDAAGSPLARQLDGITSFESGPATADGTVYAFEYGGAQFGVIDTYESGVAGVSSDSPQLAWLQGELDRTHADARFVVGHVPLAPMCYEDAPLCHQPAVCPYEATLPWEAPTDMPDMAALARTLAEHGVTAHLHGRDDIPGRRLLDGSGAVLYDRLIFDVFDTCTGAIDATGMPTEWTELQAQPNVFWQVDAGGVGTGLGSYAIVTVTADETRFELFAYLEGRPTQLLDTWSVSR